MAKKIGEHGHKIINDNHSFFDTIVVKLSNMEIEGLKARAIKHNFNLMIFGLVLSVLLVVTLARFFAEKIKKHQWFGYLGLFVILLVAIQLIIGGLNSNIYMWSKSKFSCIFSSNLRTNSVFKVLRLNNCNFAK